MATGNSSEGKHKAAATDELIEQLKMVIRAQHEKIEELRTQTVVPTMQSSPSLSSVSSVMQMHLLEDAKRESDEVRLERTRLAAQVKRLTNQMRELRARNEDLKRTSRRYAAMLSQSGEVHSNGSVCSGFAPTPALTDMAIPESGPSIGPSPSASPAASGAFEDSTASRFRTSGTSVPNRSPSPPSGSPAAGASARLTRASRVSMGLWHEMSNRGLLSVFLHAASQLVEGGQSVAATLYVVDPWLRGAMAEQPAGTQNNIGCQMMRPSTLYLGGTVRVDAYRRDGGRAEMPCFSDVAALPPRGSGAAMALPLQSSPGEPMLAVLQVAVANVGPPEKATSRAKVEAMGVGAGQTLKEENKAVSGGVLALSDSQVMSLQLLCSTAAGILGMRRQVATSKAVQRRTRECLGIAAEVHCARNLVDFEQSVKAMMTKFFNVAIVRVSFYDPDSKELLTIATRANRRKDDENVRRQSSAHVAHVGRRNITKFPVREGVCGHCLQRQEVIHLNTMLDTPFLSEKADGVELSSTASEHNMLAGPMSAHFSDGKSTTVVPMGVLQLVQKKPRADGDPADLTESNEGQSGPKSQARTNCVSFSSEDEDFFTELLCIVGLAAYRTMQAQSRAGDEDGVAVPGVSIERLLAM